jgi:hypothetical protein
MSQENRLILNMHLWRVMSQSRHTLMLLLKQRDTRRYLQPRGRDEGAYVSQALKIQNKLQPEWVVDSAEVQTGAPMIGADGFVESGNGRMIGIRRAYKHNQAVGYKEYLKQNAERFGFSPDDVDGMKRPVLVRVRTSEVDRGKFVDTANQSITAALSASEQAIKDAKRLPNLETFDLSESGGLESAANRPFIRKFFKDTVSDAELTALIDSNGMITQAGLIRLKNAIFQKAFSDSSGLLGKMAESSDSNIKNITNGMLKSSPKYASMREKIKSGNLHDLDISSEIGEAGDKMAFLRDQGISVADYGNQGVLLGEKLGEVPLAILNFFDENKRSSNSIARFVSDFADEVERIGNPKQNKLFDDGPIPSKIEIINKIIADIAKDKSTNQE